MLNTYLAEVFSLIVLPMTKVYKRIMSYFHLAIEGELFSSDLKFRLCHLQDKDQNIHFTGDSGLKLEDTNSNLQTIKRYHKERFVKAFYELVRKLESEYEDPHAKTNAAIAVYLTTYFDDNNLSSKEYACQHSEDSAFQNFMEIWKKAKYDEHDEQQHPEAELAKLEDQMFRKKIYNDKNYFHQVCAEAEEGNPKKMQRLLDMKKIFCVPWILVGEILLSGYPDKYDTSHYRDTLKSKYAHRDIFKQ